MADDRAAEVVPDPGPRLLAYLLAHRAFVAHSVSDAVALLGIRAGARLLDAGTGAGGALVPLVTAAPGTTVLGVDRDPSAVAVAAELVAASEVEARVHLRVGDLLDVLAEVGTTGTGYDVIWAGDVVWPGGFDDPGDVVRRMAGALAPGGVVALFTSSYYRTVFLPGRSRLTGLLRSASRLRWGLPDDGPAHEERHVGWLVEAGLEQVRVRMVPRVDIPVGADPVVRAYLAQAVWPQMLESAVGTGPDVGMTVGDIDLVRVLLTPGSPRYVRDDPGYYLVHPMLLATGAGGGGPCRVRSRWRRDPPRALTLAANDDGRRGGAHGLRHRRSSEGHPREGRVPTSWTW